MNFKNFYQAQFWKLRNRINIIKEFRYDTTCSQNFVSIGLEIVGGFKILQTHAHTEVHFISVVFLRKCSNKTKNVTSAEINDIVNSIEGENMDYWSVDSVLEVVNSVQYLLEVLNTLNRLGFPAHRLIINIGISIMLLRYLCPPKLCNGTRLHVTAVQKNVLDATVITGCAKGESVDIPRIPSS